MTTEEQQVRAEARGHAGTCPVCGFVLLKYGREVNEALATRTLPEPVADKIRAQLCRKGAVIFDRVMGVGHA
jgi:hypothetical protein